MNKTSYQPKSTIRVYHGYGHKENLVVYGHVLAHKPPIKNRFTDNLLLNIIHLIKLFFVKPIPNKVVQLTWNNQLLETKTAKDGFFKFEWKSNDSVSAGWHPVIVNSVDENKAIVASGEGKIFIPHSTQYGFISDIDDTVLVSHSAETGKKLRVMFTKNPRSRKTFADVVKYYQMLSLAHTTPNLLNPFFYVSSSEWNLYDDLNEFFKYNDLPKGAFLLNEIKKWYQLFKTGKTKHQGKLIRVRRILEVFPKQRFILLGDNSQKDPEIYVSIANKFPQKIVAIYIRNISLEKEKPTNEIFSKLINKDICALQFKHTDEAIAHSKSIGLINFE
ncbi:App1 family protein [Arcicella sp. LKC2W]|uniref:App1 family protein n=1 Tax=Arcicella sp. LKC2W TaxID=2984198 RepID=UPI002B1EC9DC|nr:App1 family protein [Arcicella sp. LKC2W]MEA5460944.1 App1 family protein [Arcicella sp. LKC2W]